MINNFITKTSAGLYCAEGDFYLDPKRAVPKALVSHAHSDHAVATRGMVYCTNPTRSFMLHRIKSRNVPQFIVTDYHVPFFINGIKITYYPAGHILGSAQILMEHENEKYLYTGDFKTQEDDSCEAFHMVECDHLITETTFASPDYCHPDPKVELAALINEDRNVIIGAYALGKAQRITQLLTRHGKGKKVFVHPDLVAFHRMYEEYGIALGEWHHYHRDEFVKEISSFLIVPPAYFSRFRQVNVMRVFATGWKRSFYSCDRILQVSDHADWPGLLDVIEKSRPKKVYTVHGNGAHLREYLKDRIEVKIIG